MPTVAGFDWDDGNRLKCLKHGVSLAEIEQIFRSGPLVFPDRTGDRERRYNAVGITEDGRHIFAVYTLRDKSGVKLIRPISARYMHRKEIASYDRTH